MVKSNRVRSSELNLAHYGSDKTKGNNLRLYDTFFEPWLAKNLVLLELGIYQGGSLLLWRDYFMHGTIVGADINLPKEFIPPDRVHVFEGSQADTPFLSHVAETVAPEGFDIIIDDASHIGYLTRKSFWHLFDHHLKPGGLYVIEDWGTGYWSDWPDGKSLNPPSFSFEKFQNTPFLRKLARKLKIKFPFRSHNFGMVGFVKQLVDEQGAADVSKKRLGGSATRKSRFESVTITPSLVFVKKARI